MPYTNSSKDGIYFIEQQEFQESFYIVQVIFWNDDYKSTTSTVWND